MWPRPIMSSTTVVPGPLPESTLNPRWILSLNPIRSRGESRAQQIEENPQAWFTDGMAWYVGITQKWMVAILQPNLSLISGQHFGWCPWLTDSMNKENLPKVIIYPDAWAMENVLSS